MNKLRVFQNVKRKRTASGFHVRNLGTVLLLLLLLPYIITCFFGNLQQEKETMQMSVMVREQLGTGRYTVVNKTPLGEERIPLELYVADKLARTMGSEYEMECLKAQAVLIRTNLLPEEKYEIQVEDDKYGKTEICEKHLLAAAETKGVFLEYQGAPILAAYFPVSAGETRNAGEVLESSEYPYLCGASCERDFLSEDFASTVTYKKREFEALWENIKEGKSKETPEMWQEKEEAGSEMEILTDSAGYVLFFRNNGEWITGEQLREEYHLPSAHFQLREEGDEIIFSVKGAGHGIGMSQFGANEMAKEKKSYTEILEYFFKDINFSKAE